MLAGIFDSFLTLLYPPRCLVCRVLGESSLCTACAAQITPIAAPFCAVCGHSLADSRCTNCSAQAPAFRCSRSLGAYHGVLSHAIHQFKYRDRPQLAVPLGRQLAEYARDHSAELNHLRFDALVPVPMHPARRRVRGYNQSERLARVVGEQLGLPVLPDALLRARAARPQVGLSAEARRANLRGAFAVQRPDFVSGRTLLLIDDVMTTGSSLHECAAMLNAAGAKAVYALTLAAG